MALLAVTKLPWNTNFVLIDLCQLCFERSALAAVDLGSGSDTNERHHEKTCLWGLQPGMTQTGLLARVLKFRI